MAELRRLDMPTQLSILGVLGDLRGEHFQGQSAGDHGGKISRNGKIFYRIRIGDLRFYFEFIADGILCHHILPRHSFEDFCFRCGFAAPNERAMEEDGKLWEFLEDGDNKPTDGE
jgi:mRNA interferase RelE/StbE